MISRYRLAISYQKKSRTRMSFQYVEKSQFLNKKYITFKFFSLLKFFIRNFFLLQKFDERKLNQARSRMK